MKKKIIGVISVLALIVALALTMIACNPYEWKGIGGGEPDAEVESNGGYVVKQGKYLYYVNGYEGTGGENNEWGTPVKQSIVRSEIVDGKVDNSTTKVVVPKIIYNSSTKGGFAIYGEWIYYATPNNDRNKNGVASTTDTDFMRTKIDGSVTQRIGKIGTRSAEYLFTPTRILYYTSNTLSFIDFSGMKTDKSFDNGKGAYEGTLAENVSSVVWNMQSEAVYYTQTITGENSYKNYNELCAINVNGENRRVLATEDTFVTATDKDGNKTPATQPQKVFKYTLRDMFIEADGSHTLYYTKTHYVSSDTQDGLFCAKATNVAGTEKRLEALGATTVYPLGYADGAIVNSSSAMLIVNGNVDEDRELFKETKAIWRIDAQEGALYFTATSSATKLEKIAYKTPGNAEEVMIEGIKVDWLRLDFVGDELYFFASDDSNTLHRVNVKTFDKNAVDEDGNAVKSDYVGFVREETEEEE